MIYDVFHFNDEIDLLRLRLSHHKEFVDRFVVLECSRTYSGTPKPMHSLQSEPLQAMIDAGRAYVIRMDFPIDADAGWEFEHVQRDMVQGLRFNADDVVIYCDTDEIVHDGEVVREFVEGGKQIQSLQMDLYFYWMNVRLKQGEVPGANYHVATCFKSKWHMGKIMRGEWFNAHKGHAYQMREHELWAERPDMIERAGWHYSNLGGADRVFAKIQAISHFRDSEFAGLTKDVLADRMKGLSDICGRPGVELEVVTDDLIPLSKTEREYYDRYLYHA